MKRLSAIFACLTLCLVILSGVASAAPVKIKAADTDDLSEALKVTANQSYIVKKGNGATSQQGEIASNCVSGAKASVWFKYRADRALTLTIDTQWTDFDYPSMTLPVTEDTVLTVYSATNGSGSSFANLTHVDCNDDIGEGRRFSRLNLTTTPGMWYFIRVTPFSSAPLPETAKFALNISADNLLDKTSWQFKGAGKADDVMNCTGECYFNFNHSAAGKSKLVQNITSFQGVNLSVGSLLQLSGQLYISGANQNYTMALTVFYTDGTSVTKTVKFTDITRLSDSLLLETKFITIAKPVASINVMFKDNVTTDGFVSLSNVQLRAYNPDWIATRAALPMPGLEAAAK